MKVCVSIPVHEAFEVVLNQVDNYRHFLLDCYVVLHVSANNPELKQQLLRHFKGSTQVFINPISMPTAWGWVFHTFLSNYGWVRRSLGLEFDYFVLETSNSLLVSSVPSNLLSQFECLMNIRTSQQQLANHPQWWVAKQSRIDPCFVRMCHELKIQDWFAARCEGCTFSVSLFDGILAFCEKYYIYDPLEDRYAREEIYFPTLVAHLTASVGPQLTLTEGEIDIKMVETVRDYATKGMPCYGVKPVTRKLDDPVRHYITGLIE